jgi:hypothetical protein
MRGFITAVVLIVLAIVAATAVHEVAIGHYPTEGVSS